MSDSDRGVAQLVAIFIRHSDAIQNFPERHRKNAKKQISQLMSALIIRKCLKVN